MPSFETVAKTVIVTAIDEIPEVGGIIGMFVDLLWEEATEKPLTWDEIRERTEELISQRLDDDSKERLNAAYEGLKQNLDNYRNAAGLPPSQVYATFAATRSVLDLELPTFQTPSHAVVLLPLFAQAANLHLLLLTDAVRHGAANMGMTTDDATKVHKRLKDLTTRYSAWAHTTFDQGLAKLSDPGARSDYVRQMTIDVLDYTELWPYLDSDTPAPAQPLLTREVFSRAFGIPWVSPATTPPQRGYYPVPPAGARVTSIKVGKVNPNNVGVECVSVHYDTYATGWMGHVPPQVTATVWEANVDDHGGLAAICTGLGQNVVTAIGLRFVDGTTVGLNGGSVIEVPDGHYLSSVQLMSAFYDADRLQLYNDVVRSIWYGFRFRRDALTALPSATEPRTP